MVPLKKISLKDIAEAAGVSPALVSFVLNGHAKEYRVGEETALRVEKIAREMNYQPNLAAKNLRCGKTDTIGLVVSDISNPFFAQIARALEDKAIRHGYTVLFGSSDEDTKKMERVVGNLINKGVDGLIVVPCENSEKAIASLLKNNVPLVLLDRYFPELNVSYVSLNNFDAAYTATHYLIEEGYKHPGLVAYDIDLVHMKERIRGYKRAMEDAGMKNLAHVGFIRQDTTRRLAERLIHKMTDAGVDSFLFGTNMIALTCLYTIKDMIDGGKRKLGLVSFDGSPAFDFFDAPISYMKQPIDVLVQKSLSILLDNIENGNNTVQSVLAEGVFTKRSH